MQYTIKLRRSEFLSWFFALLFCALPAKAQLQYYSNVLHLKDIDSMQQLIRKELASYYRAAEKPKFRPSLFRSDFVAALKIALARPNDGRRTILFEPLSTELKRVKIYESVLATLVKESTDALEKSTTKPEEKTTYMLILENMIEEVSPEIKKNNKIRKIISFIAKKDLQIDEATKSSQLLSDMQTMASPSKTATIALQKHGINLE